MFAKNTLIEIAVELTTNPMEESKNSWTAIAPFQLTGLKSRCLHLTLKGIS